MNFLNLFTFLLIAISWILAEMEVKAERRTFDFLKKHHHKHRKEDHHNEHYFEVNDFDGYHDAGLHNGGHYPSVHVHHTYGGVHGYGIGESGFHGGAIHTSRIHGNNLYGSNFHGGYIIGGNHFGSEIFGDEGLEHNVLSVQDEGVHGDFGEVHEYGGNHGSHLTHFG